MLARYVEASGDTSILTRAMPSAEVMIIHQNGQQISYFCLSQIELAWWDSNRSIQITSPFSNATFKMYRYNADNSAPRPETYMDGTYYSGPNGRCNHI